MGYASKIVGDEEVERRSWSNDLGGGRRSISGQSNREPLVPCFLTRLPKYGSALLIHSNIPPAHIQGREWWRIRRLAAMVPPAVAERSAAEAVTGTGPWTPTPPRPVQNAKPVPVPVPVPVVEVAVQGELSEPELSEPELEVAS